MRRYMLVSAEARSNVDLRDYADTITDAVRSIMPRASVEVLTDSYLVSPTPNQSEAVRIGRLICQSELRKHCVMIPKLFTSEEVEVIDDGENGEASEHSNGGHH